MLFPETDFGQRPVYNETMYLGQAGRCIRLTKRHSTPPPSAMKQCIWDKPAVYQAHRAAFVFSPSALKQCIWEELRCIRLSPSAMKQCIYLTVQLSVRVIFNETMYLSGKSWRSIGLISRGHHCVKDPPSFFLKIY